MQNKILKSLQHFGKTCYFTCNHVNHGLTDANNYLNYLAGRVRRENHIAVDQEAAIFHPS